MRFALGGVGLDLLSGCFQQRTSKLFDVSRRDILWLHVNSREWLQDLSGLHTELEESTADPRQSAGVTVF
jgi:hypothetical protein